MDKVVNEIRPYFSWVCHLLAVFHVQIEVSWIIKLSNWTRFGYDGNIFFQRYGFWFVHQDLIFKTTRSTWQFGVKVHFNHIWSPKGSLFIFHYFKHVGTCPRVCVLLSYFLLDNLRVSAIARSSCIRDPHYLRSPLGGPCDHSSHIWLLCNQGEWVRVAEAQANSLHWAEDIWKFKGNVWKKCFWNLACKILFGSFSRNQG